MEEQDAIVSCLQTTRQLLQATAAKTAGDLDLNSWIERYERLSEQLAGARNQDPEVLGEARSCWKIAQDILIRLRRVRSAPKDAVSAEEGHTTVVFSERDIETLDRRLLDLQQRIEGSTGVTPLNE
jgi:uncharacterized protein (UPF0335 family)